MKNLKKSLLLLTGLLLMIAGCATFEGSIPIQGPPEEGFYISPANGDGIQDRLEIPMEYPNLPGLNISSLEFSIERDDGSSVYSLSEAATRPVWYKRLFGAKASLALPEALGWDGRDQEGDLVPDGIYYARVSVADRNGNSGETPPYRIIVDNTAPSAVIEYPFSVVSPNGDGNQDILDLYFVRATSERTWTGELVSSAGEVVESFNWADRPTTVHWSGISRDGVPLNDGEYRFILSATDLAGNSFRIETLPLQVDSAIPPISARLSATIISPNGDGIADSLELTLNASSPERILSSRVTVINQQGTILRSLPGSGNYPRRFIVDGLDERGRAIPDGVYYLRFEAEYRNGAKPSIVTPAITIDTAAPYAVIGAEYLLFSPDGDGRRDTLSLYQNSEAAVEWTGVLASRDGVRVASYRWSDRAQSLVWNGRSDSGAIVPDGIYRYTLTGIDEGGNRTVKTIDDIRVDSRPTPIRISPVNPRFSPNGDGVADNARFLPALEIRDGVVSWQFEVLNEESASVFLQQSLNNEPVPEEFLWSPSEAPEGSYRGRLTVEYEKGNRSEFMSEESVTVDLSGPDIRIALTPLPFGPDGDGVNDRLKISIQVKDQADVASVNGRILDPAGNIFAEIPAAGFSAAGWEWNGRSPRGELVQAASDYQIAVSARDSLGNQSRAVQTLPVDVLVIRDGDRLRISISSIYFKPNTADYLNVDPELAEKNLATLDRLAEILKRYGEYRIRLEGHGVRIYWDQPSRWPAEERDVLAPLSRNRADAIKAALSARGIRADRMTIQGFGGSQPVVPHGDLENRWKNRRVEFILIK